MGSQTKSRKNTHPKYFTALFRESRYLPVRYEGGYVNVAALKGLAPTQLINVNKQFNGEDVSDDDKARKKKSVIFFGWYFS